MTEADPTPFKVAMNDAEKALLGQHLSKASLYYEFGAGGSTLFALNHSNIKKVWSVESDLAWIQKLTPYIDPARCELIHGNIGPTTDWGHPSNAGAQRSLFKNYWEHLQFLNDTPDFFLIDGRFRVETCLQALIKCPNATYAVHDFTIRPQYNPILKFTDVVETVDTLVILKRRADAIDYEILSTARHYEGTPA